MRRVIMLFLVLTAACWLAVEANSNDDTTVAELERIIAECEHPLKVPAGIFKQIKVLQGVEPRPDSRALRTVKDEGLVHVFVDSVVHQSIQTNLNQFVLDLQADGYSVVLTPSWNQTPELIRAVLQSEYGSSGLVGAIFVGDVPAAWMETFMYYRSHFPTDYFYMDLDGTWTDHDADGFYDNLGGNLEPEIWTGRITPSGCIFGDEPTLLNRYFEKNHAYRTGTLVLPDRALGYMECTWYPQIETYLNSVYDDVTFVDNEDATTALDYKYRLTQGYEWVHLLAHSSPWGSTFYMHNDTYGGGSVFSYEIPPLNPQANFVVLNACSNAKYTETNNLGQSYLFGSDNVVAIIGETRIMYGNDFEDFYASLQIGRNLGDAFLDWMWWNYEWFWGCHIFGDPTLKPHGHGNPVSASRFSAQIMPKGTVEWDSSPVDISPFTDGDPSACVDHQGNVWAAWNAARDIRANIWTSRFDGMAWSEPEEIAFSVPWDFHPSMTRDNAGNVWIFWQSYRESDNGTDGWDIYAVYNGGSVWSDPMRVTTAEPYDVEPRSAVDSSGNVWVVWRTERKPDSDIMCRYWNGYGWSTAEYLASSADEERDPVVAVDRDGNVWVVWYARKEGNWDIYARYYDGGAWSSQYRVTNDPGYDVQPSVATDSSGKVWIVWRTNRNGNLDIYSKYRVGMTWSADSPISTDPGDDICPSITCYDGDKILVTWQSNREGAWNVYQSTHQSHWSIPSPVALGGGNRIQPVALCSADGASLPIFSSDADQNWNIYCTMSFIRGDATGDGMIDLGDPVRILNYLFRGDPAPVPLAAADANCDQVADLADAIYLLNYLYKGGDPPGC